MLPSPSIRPILALQYWPPIRETCLVALRADRTEIPRRLYFAAHRRVLRVDAAMRRSANDALQGGAAWLRLVGTTQRHAVVIEFLGQFRRYVPTQKCLRFRPMEGNAKMRAAGAATQGNATSDQARAHPEAHRVWIPERVRPAVQRASLVSFKCRSGFAGKCVALVHVAAAEAGLEPLHPLRRSAVGERVRTHPAL